MMTSNITLNLVAFPGLCQPKTHHSIIMDWANWTFQFSLWCEPPPGRAASVEMHCSKPWNWSPVACPRAANWWWHLAQVHGGSKIQLIFPFKLQNRFLLWVLMTMALEPRPRASHATWRYSMAHPRWHHHTGLLATWHICRHWKESIQERERLMLCVRRCSQQWPQGGEIKMFVGIGILPDFWLQRSTLLSGEK